MYSPTYCIQTYGFTTWSSLFTNRQLQTLTTFCDLLQELDQKLEEDQSTKQYTTSTESTTQDGQYSSTT